MLDDDGDDIIEEVFESRDASRSQRQARGNANITYSGGRTLKICILGLARAGKTALCQTVGNQDRTNPHYSPTEGVRIQELERRVAGGSCIYLTSN